MTRIHLFNPENDLALAADEPHYTPRANAGALAAAGSLLPAWWASPGDFIAASAEDEPSARFLRERFGLECEIFDPATDSVDGAEPWGWSRYAKAKLQIAGVPGEVLPSDDIIARYRRLSNRATAAEVNSYIVEHQEFDLQLPEPALLTANVDEAMAFIARREGKAFVKSPWSSSGRGVFSASAMSETTLRTQIQGIIRRQGMVTVERALDKVMDFATLYECRAGRVRFIGWSVFATFDRCAYLGNIVAPQPMLQSFIAERLGDEAKLLQVRRLQQAAIETLIAPQYEGVLGVDMMVYNSRGRHGVAPCIEVNLRRTMGMTALALAEKLDIPRPQIFKVEYRKGKQVNAPGKSVDILPPSRGFNFLLEDAQNDFKM